MMIYLAGVSGLVVWLVLWALGVKSFDAMLLFLAIVLVATCVRVLLPYLPGNRGGDDEAGSGGSRIPR